MTQDDAISGFELEAMKTKIIIGSILGGVAVTLLTGLVSNTPPMWVGAILYGYPLPWLTRMIVAPQYYPWRVETANLLVDIIVWTIVIGALLFLLTKAKK
jgi:hypothetical protein